ncbi:MAG: helix-turn-helix domain-containing protein [Myxococcales bacterium]
MPSVGTKRAHGSAQPPSHTPSVGARLRPFRGGADNLLTVREVAARLHVSTATVYALADRGKLAHVRVSNAIRVAPEDLAAYVAAHRKGRS